MRVISVSLAIGILLALAPVSAPHEVGAAPCSYPYTFGDIDAYGGVEAGDAAWILRDTVDLPLPDLPCASEDVDCDGQVSSVDSLKILRYIVGLPYSTAPECP